MPETRFSPATPSTFCEKAQAIPMAAVTGSASFISSTKLALFGLVTKIPAVILEKTAYCMPTVIDQAFCPGYPERSEEHTSELQSLMRISYAVFCLKKKNTRIQTYSTNK